MYIGARNYPQINMFVSTKSWLLMAQVMPTFINMSTCLILIPYEGRLLWFWISAFWDPVLRGGFYDGSIRGAQFQISLCYPLALQWTHISSRWINCKWVFPCEITGWIPWHSHQTCQGAQRLPLPNACAGDVNDHTNQLVVANIVAVMTAAWHDL